MSENVENSTEDVEMNNLEMQFENIIILKEFENIVKLVRPDEFLEIFITPTNVKKLKWVPLFDYLKQRIVDDMVEELESMWKYENMTEKLQELDKQKEKFSEINEDQVLWRPQLGDVKAQLRAHDAASLRKQKAILENLAVEYETRVNHLKKILTARRGYLKAFQMEIQKYQNKIEEHIPKLHDKLEKLSVLFPRKVDVDDLSWTDKDLD